MDLSSVSDPNDLMATLAGRDELQEIFGKSKKVNQNELKLFVSLSSQGNGEMYFFFSFFC